MPKALPEATRQRIAALAREGRSCGSIARELGVARSSVSRIAGQLGTGFVRSEPKEAGEAHRFDVKASMAELQVKLAQTAHRLHDDLYRPALVYSFGGRDNTFASETLDEPDARTKRELLTAAAIAVDKVKVIEGFQERDGQGKAAVLRLVDTLSAAVENA